MLLSESTLLLGDQGKYFSDVYKIYDYKDDQLLKDYLDFVIHEPIEWMRGFPAKLVTKSSFSKPKSALIKLLKQDTVIQALGESYIKKVYDVMWSTFKKHADDVIASRHNKGAVTTLDQFTEQPTLVIEEEINDAESVHSVRLPRKTGSIDWKNRYHILEEAYKNLIVDLSDSAPGLAKSALTLLTALSSA